MKKVLLLNPPADSLLIREYYSSFSAKAAYYWPPQDLVVLSGLLTPHFELRVIDAVAGRLSREKVLRMIAAEDFSALVFSTGSASLLQDSAFAGELKKRFPEILLAASAGIIKFDPAGFMARFPDIDAGLLDFSDPEIISFLHGEPGPWRTIWQRRRGVLQPAGGDFSAPFSIAPPRHDLFPYRQCFLPTARRRPFAVVVTSLGCPHACRFCTAGAYGWKLRPAQNVLEELSFIRSLGFPELLFLDPSFTVHGDHSRSILQGMISSGFGFSFSGNADIRTLSEEKIVLLKEAGCHTLYLGLESGSDRLLQRYGKPLDTNGARRSVSALRRHGIRTLGYFIIGLPGENAASARQTIDLARELDLDFASFAMATPDIGTDLRAEALQKGWISKDTDSFDSSVSAVLDLEEFPAAQVLEWRRRAEREFYLRPGYIWNRLKTIDSPRDFCMLVRAGRAALRRMI